MGQTLDRALWGARWDLWGRLEGLCLHLCTEEVSQVPSLPTSKVQALVPGFLMSKVEGKHILKFSNHPKKFVVFTHLVMAHVLSLDFLHLAHPRLTIVIGVGIIRVMENEMKI